jgi:tRNA/rRNA methyltransferase
VPIGALILVETSSAGNLGAVMRIAANFGVPTVELVKPRIGPDDDEVLRWACGAEEHLTTRSWRSVDEATASYRCLVGTASGRGRERQPVITPQEAVPLIVKRGLEGTALLFGNETSGLGREDLDRCDFIVRVPSRPEFPVLNLAQTVAILTAYLSIEAEDQAPQGVVPAPMEQLEGLMAHLRRTLIMIGFLDPANPARILRKIRRMLGRAGVTENEVSILRGICRQVDWATRFQGKRAGQGHSRFVQHNKGQ